MHYNVVSVGALALNSEIITMTKLDVVDSTNTIILKDLKYIPKRESSMS